MLDRVIMLSDGVMFLLWLEAKDAYKQWHHLHCNVGVTVWFKDKDMEI